MHVRTVVVSLSLVVLGAVTVEPQMLAALSAYLGVPADNLKKEMTSNNLNFGQIYLAHAIAKAANTDVTTILSDSKSKLWTTIAQERKVDMKKIAADESEFEKSMKNQKRAAK